MKTKTQFTNRILSLVLTLVMVVGMLPMTAYAATEAMDFANERQYITYSSGTAQYFFYKNYLYKAVYTNITVSKIGIAQSGSYLVLKSPEFPTVHDSLMDESGTWLKPENLPKNQNSALEGYSVSQNFSTPTGSNDVKVVTITLVEVNEPTWSWTGTSSATATFTAKDADVFATAEATISSENDAANTKTIYTATVTFNGTKYTDTKIVSVPHEHPICGDSDCSDSAHTANDSWTAWDGTTAFPGGNVYLSDEVILSAPISVTGTVSLCLNGHGINAAGGYFDVASNGTLNLCSCKDDGIIKRTSTTEALISADNGATVNLYNVTLDGGAVWGGTTDAALLRGTSNSGIVSDSPLIDAGYQRTTGGHITLNSGVILQNNECSDAGDGGAITLGEDGTLVINGATICNNAKTDGNAGAIKAYAGAEITLNSGEIYGNSAYKHGGAIQIFGGDSTDNADAVLTMNGGAIRNNKAAGVGGGIAVSNYSQFVMNGGSIIDNATTDSQKRGGGVGFADRNTAMSVSGNAVISGNTANNLYIGTNSCNILTVGAMGSAANIGVTMKSSSGGVFTISGATYADKFISDSSAYAVAVDGSNLKLVKQFTVSFDNNSGTGSKDSVKVSDGEEYTLPANPFTAPSGYQFKGWATSQNGDVLQDEKIIVSENVTLYAIWKKIPAEMPTVAVSENLTLTYGEYTGQKFTATIEKKDGYTYEYQWIDGNTVISNTDTLAIPDDLTVGEYDYYLAVGAKRIDNGEITWYSNPNLLVKVNPKELDASNVTLSKDAFTYDGNEQKPTVTVNVGGKTLTENTDYTVTWPSDCKNAGTKTITVTFKGNYGGTAQANYEIKQKEIGISWGATEFIPYTGELIVPQATATGLANGDVCTLTTSVVDTTEGAGIIPGRWHAKVTSLSNDNYCLPASGNLVEVEYGIVKGYTAAPVVSGIDETVKGKADGKINGLTTTMEYATEYTADDDKYTKVMDANMTFAAGTYYVRYQAAGYYNASPFTEVTIKDGGLLSVSVPATQTGYTLTVADTELVWNGSTTLTFVLKNGYSKTGAFAVKVNGTPVALDSNDQYVITNAQANIEITVEGVADITPPAAEIKVKENNWTSFWNNLTFGLFFKETQDVTITAADKGSGVKSIQYYLSNGELELDEVRAITEWQTYNGTFKINPNNQYVIYAKVADNSGNTVYLNSAGIVLDATAPSVYGIEDGGVYYGDKIFKAMDDNFLKIEVDGVDITDTTEGDDEFKIVADNAEHTVTVTDKAGNVTEYKITVYKNYTVTFKADGVTVDTQTVGYGKDATVPTIPTKDGYTQTAPTWDKDGKNITADTEINAVYTINKYTVTFKADGVTVDTQTVGYGKDATVPTIPTKDGYTQTAPTWDKDGKNITADTEINAVYTINKYTVTYKADGEVVGTVTVEHGKDATAPVIPEKEGYTQTAPTWDKDGKNITADTEINAVYTINKYTVTYKADGEVVSTVEVEHGGDVEAPAVPAKSGYVGKWDAIGKDITKDTTISAVYTAILDVKADEVKPEDKTELEDTKKQLEDMLDDDSYTEDDKKNIQDAIDNIDEALEVIGNVENVEELIDKLPNTIKKDDEPAIKVADDAYNALTDYEKSLVDEDAKKALDDAKAALAELNKPADPNSPQTGDNSNMFLWVALLFISGGAVITLTVVDRKRRMASK